MKDTDSPEDLDRLSQLTYLQLAGPVGNADLGLLTKLHHVCIAGEDQAQTWCDAHTILVALRAVAQLQKMDYHRPAHSALVSDLLCLRQSLSQAESARPDCTALSLGGGWRRHAC